MAFLYIKPKADFESAYFSPIYRLITTLTVPSTRDVYFPQTIFN